MKILIAINYIVLIVPLLFALGGFADEDNFFYALMSTAVTGAVQVIIAVITLFLRPKSELLYIYFAITTLFFLLWAADFAGNAIFCLPPMLAIYLTIVLHILSRKPKTA